MKRFKKILWAFLAVLLVIQFFHPERNSSSTTSANHISKAFIIPADVQSILDKSCDDCHSNNTVYPWYVHVQPVDWWMNGHIHDGKEELNFDEFSSYSPRRQFHKFEEIAEQVKEDEMPISSYTFIHRDAILTVEQKEKVIRWSQEMQQEMKAKYPPDSLKRKQRPA
jgi:hypothetical protein